VRLSAWTLDGRDFASEALFFIDQLATTFEAFARRIADHAQYEDQSLFAFFTALLPEFNAMGLALTAQHQEMDAMEVDIVENISALKAGMEARNAVEVKRLSPLLLSQFSEYQQLIIEHLATEENSLVGPWLHLTSQQYSEYQDKYLAPFGHSASSIPIVGDHARGTEQPADKRARDEEEAKQRAREEEARQKAEQARRKDTQQLQEERTREEEERQRRQVERAKREAAEKKKTAGPPKLYDRHGREVDMTRPGCCFDGVDGCCKGSAYQRLLAKSGYVLDPKTGTYILK